ncbi:MAG: hypothetical protein ABIQ30_13435 [Devosia sp.]
MMLAATPTVRMTAAPDVQKVAAASLFGDDGESGSLFGGPPAAPEAPPTATDITSLYDLDATAASNTLDTAVDLHQSLNQELQDRLSGQGPRLLALFRPLGDEQLAYESALARGALADHWWVQVQVDGKWVDYDLLSLDGVSGSAVAAPSETLDGDVPVDAKQRVQLKVISEQLIGGQLREATVFEHEFDPSAVIGQRIALRSVPLLWPAEWDAITPDDVQEKLFAALYTQTEWMPTLTVGKENFQQSSIIDTGVVNPDPNPQSNPFFGMTFSAAGKVGRITDLFGQLLDESDGLGGDEPAAPVPENAPRAQGELTAEWLEYTIIVPGQAPITTRRELFDILGPSLRRGGDFSTFEVDEAKRLERAAGEMTDTDIVILPCWPAPEYLADLTAGLVLANKPVLDEFSRDPFGKSPPNSMELFSKMDGMPGPAYFYSMLRSEAEWTNQSVFIDRPQVVTQHGVLSRVGPGEMSAAVALDVVENGVGADPFSGRDPFLLRLLQGVADTNAEALAMPGSGDNTSTIFEQDANAPEWTVFFPADKDKLATLGLPPDLSARLLADLENGNAIVSRHGSAEDFRAGGWWRINPLTGTTLGMGSRGWGQDLVEYAFQLMIQVMMAQIACMATTAVEEGHLKSLNAEQGREKVKTWARNCVSQALLQTVAGLSMSWIQSRFIDGAKVPTWNERAAANNTPHGRLNSSAPHIEGDGARPKPPGPHTDPDTPSPSKTPPDVEGRRSEPSCVAQAYEVLVASLSEDPSLFRNDAAPLPRYASAAGCSPRLPGAPQPDHQPEVVSKVKAATDEALATRKAEVDAAKRYFEDPTPANRAAYAEAERVARRASDVEQEQWWANNGRGVPPGTHGREPIPPPPPGWNSLDRADTVAPPAPPRPSSDLAPPIAPANPDGSVPSNRTQPLPNAPQLPPQNDAERLVAIRGASEARAAAQQQEIAAEEAYKLNKSPENMAAMERADTAYNRAHMAELDAWVKAGGRGFPHNAQLGDPGPSLPNEAVSLPPQPANGDVAAGRTIAPISGESGPAPAPAANRTQPLPAVPATAVPQDPEVQKGGQDIRPIDQSDGAKPVPVATPRQPQLSTPEKIVAVRPYTADIVAAHNQEVVAAQEFLRSDSPATRAAYDRAVVSADVARQREAGAWYKIGGEGFPPSRDPGVLQPLPQGLQERLEASNTSSSPPTGAAQNKTLAVGLGSLVGTIQRGP